MDLSNENVTHKKGNGIEYLQFRKLNQYSDIISHAYSLGLDKNFRLSRKEPQVITKEEYELGLKSYNILLDELNLNIKNLVKTNQRHTKNVECVYDAENTTEGNFEKHKNTDGLITNKQDLVLATTNADCILLIFFDPVKRVIANTHSGWRGTLQRISIETVNKMIKEYGCNPEDIICCICPSIRKCHFEVEKDVYDLFCNEFQDLNLDEIIEKNGKKWNIDTVLINKIILKRAGLKEENIIDSGICSVCNKDIIHSYRVEGPNYGLSTAVISLK